MSDVRIIRMKNVRTLADKAGGITAFAKLIGRSQPYVSSRIGKTQSAYIGHQVARDIEQILGLAPFYLDTVHDDYSFSPSVNESKSEYYASTRLPLLTVDDVTDFINNPLEFDLSKAQKHIPCPAEHSNRAFALKMIGDSMMANDSQSVPDGAILFFEPHLEPKPGQLALIQVEGYFEVRQITSQFGQRIAKPLNTAYPAIHLDERGTILGACIATANIFTP